MAISLRLVIALVVAVVAVATAAIAFAPTYTAGTNATLSAVEDLRASIVGRAKERLAAFFGGPRNVAGGVYNTSASDMVDLTSRPSLIKYAASVALSYAGVISTCSWFVVSPPSMVYVDASARSSFGSYVVQTNLPDVIFPNGSLQIDGLNETTRLPDPNLPRPPGYPEVFPLPFDPMAFAPPTLVRTFPNMHIMWTPVSPALNGPGISVVAALRHSAIGATPLGAFSVDVLPENIAASVATVGLRSGGRACVIDVATGVVLGLSWGEDIAVVLPGYLNQRAPVWTRFLYKYLWNVSDPLVVEVGATNNLRSNVYLPPVATSLHGDSENKVFVDSVDIQDPYGLHVRLIVAMPQIDFLREMYASRGATLGGIAGAVVALMVLGVGIAHLIAAPLQRLGARMELTASLQDDEAEDAPSALSEVRSMQESYAKMKAELNRTKAYLPQSVLHGNDDDEDEEEETQRGSVATGKGSPLARTTSDAAAVATLVRLPSTMLSPSGSEAPGNKAASSSFSDTRSNKSSVAGKRKVGPAALNTTASSLAKCVTVAVFNLCGYSGDLSGSRVMGQQSAFLALVHKIVREQKGVVDYFQGDHVFALFNAVTNTVAHGKRASLAALHVLKELRRQPAMPHGTCGISSGRAIVGNMGNDDMRRFCVVGPVFPQAVALERFCKLYPAASIMIPSSMAGEVGLEMFYQLRDIVMLPGAAEPTSIASLEGVKSMAINEWMYQLAEGEDADPFAAFNAAFQCLSSGDAAGCRQQLAFPRKQPHPVPVQEAACRAQLEALLALLEQRRPVVRDPGFFYGAWALPKSL